MLDIFFKGENNSTQKMSPHQLEKLMKTKFAIDLRLKANQRKSYFTTMAKDKIKAKLLHGKLINQKNNEGEYEADDAYLEEEEEDTDYNQLVDDLD